MSKVVMSIVVISIVIVPPSYLSFVTSHSNTLAYSAKD